MKYSFLIGLLYTSTLSFGQTNDSSKDNNLYLPCKCSEYFLNQFSAPKFGLFVSQKVLNKWKFNFVKESIEINNYCGSVEENGNIQDVYSKKANIYTNKKLLFQFNYNNCLALDLAPCRGVDTFALIPCIINYKINKPKTLDIYLYPKTLALKFNSKFLSQLNNKNQEINNISLVPASFLFKTDFVEINYDDNVKLTNQKAICYANYKFTQNDVILKIKDFEVDLSKQKNIGEVIKKYELFESINLGRKKNIFSNKIISHFTGIYSKNADVYIPIDISKKSKFLKFSATELIIGDYFSAAVLSINVTKQSNGKYLINNFGNSLELCKYPQNSYRLK